MIDTVLIGFQFKVLFITDHWSLLTIGDFHHKKLALAAAIASLAASGVASAATIYEKDNLKYTVKGDIQVQLLQDSGDDEDLDVNYDDAELKNNVTYKLDNGWKAFAQVDYDFHKESVEETYVGFDFGSVKIWVGDTDYVTDAFGVEGNIDVIDVDGDAFAEDGSDDLILAEFKAGPATIGVSFDLEDDSATEEESSFDVMVEAPVGPVALGLAYQAYSVGGVDTDTVGVSAMGEFGPVEAGIAYSVADNDNTDETSVISAVVSAAGFTVGYDVTDADAADDEVSVWYANYVYKFPEAKNVSVFAELADSDEDDTDVGYLVGMRVKF